MNLINAVYCACVSYVRSSLYKTSSERPRPICLQPSQDAICPTNVAVSQSNLISRSLHCTLVASFVSISIWRAFTTHSFLFVTLTLNVTCILRMYALLTTLTGSNETKENIVVCSFNINTKDYMTNRVILSNTDKYLDELLTEWLK